MKESAEKNRNSPPSVQSGPTVYLTGCSCVFQITHFLHIFVSFYFCAETCRHKRRKPFKCCHSLVLPPTAAARVICRQPISPVVLVHVHLIANQAHRHPLNKSASHRLPPTPLKPTLTRHTGNGVQVFLSLTPASNCTLSVKCWRGLSLAAYLERKATASARLNYLYGCPASKPLQRCRVTTEYQ